MRAHDWTDVWNLFLDWMSHQTVPAQIAIGLGTAFIAVMAVEGVRASFFPKRILKSVALRNAEPAPTRSASIAPQEESHAIWSEVPVNAAPVTVNAEAVRRSGPQRLRVNGPRKPS
jgi:hypothetical protein